MNIHSHTLTQRQKEWRDFHGQSRFTDRHACLHLVPEYIQCDSRQKFCLFFAVVAVKSLLEYLNGK